MTARCSTQSYGPKGKPISFKLKGVIPGWTEGMQLVGKGGMIELDIPYELGYGVDGREGIPGKARLHFIVELLDFITCLGQDPARLTRTYRKSSPRPKAD